jgi:hypothetical protein
LGWPKPPPMSTKGRSRPPHGAKGVAKTTPNGALACYFLEALAYSRRMAQHPHVNLTVVKFIHEHHFYEEEKKKKKEKNLEDDLIDEFISNAVKKGKKPI